MHRVIDFCPDLYGIPVKAIPHRLVRKTQTAAAQNRKADFMRCCLRSLFQYLNNTADSAPRKQEG